jgi:hypothetical protein
MSIDRMIPDLQASFACEDVRVEASGAHTIVGIVNFIGAPTLPIQVLKLCVWTRWSSGVGQFEQVTRLIAPDEETVLASAIQGGGRASRGDSPRWRAEAALPVARDLAAAAAAAVGVVAHGHEFLA